MLQKTQDRTETMNSFTEEWLQKRYTIELTLTQLSYREGKWGSRQCMKISSAARPWYPRKFLLASLCRMGPPGNVEILPNQKHDETYAVTRELRMEVKTEDMRIEFFEGRARFHYKTSRLRKFTIIILLWPINCNEFVTSI